MSDAAIDVLVIGAGIVGLSCAMRLQMDGRKVELLDPNEPASGASSGNAGYLAQGHIHPPAASVSLARLPKMLLDRTGPLVLRAGYLPRMIPWGLRAFAGLRPAPLASTMDALAQLNRRAIDSYAPYLERSGSRALFDRRGSLTVYSTTAALDVAARRIPAVRAHGLGMERLGGGELRELEPAVANEMAGAIYYPGSGRCVNPLRLGQRFAQTLASGGAVFHRAAARQLMQRADGGWSVGTDGTATLRAKEVVVSTGGRGDRLLAPLGYEVPLAAERGYHLMLPAAQVEISRPVSSGECMFVMTPMEHGLRLAGTAEYADIDAPADLRRADMLLGHAQRYLPGLSGAGATRWMGVRPSFPDGLPAIGEGHRHRNLYYCFGHQHLGLTLAAVSASLLGAVMARGTPAVDVTAYSLARFERAVRGAGRDLRAVPTRW